MSSSAPLTDKEVRDMVIQWYKNLDVHAPEYDMLPMLANEGLEMVFPEATLRGWADFELWFQGVIRIFFDEVHTMKKLDITINSDGSQADISLVVTWEASRWKAPAAKSDRLIFDAYQTWIVRRWPETGKPAIYKYVVDKLDPLPGSAAL